MAAGVVPDRGALVLGQLVENRQYVLDRGVVLRSPLQGRVRLVHVRLVVLVVVQAHRLLVDVRLERRVVVRQRRNFECHLSLLRLVWFEATSF